MRLSLSSCLLGSIMLGFLCASGMLRAAEIVSTLASVDPFNGPLDAWTARCGGNVQIALSTATTAADPTRRALVVELKRRKPADNSAAENYFLVRRLLTNAPPGADSIRLRLSASEEQSVYLTCSVLGGAWWKEYGSGPLQPSKLGPMATDFVVPLAGLKSGDKAMFGTAGETVSGFTLAGRAPVGVLRVEELSYCRKVIVSGWVAATAECGNPSSLFERGAPVIFTLKTGKAPAPDVTGLRYVVRDYHGDEAASGTLPLGATNVYTLTLHPLPTGYYELTVYALTGERALVDASCLKTTGSSQPGIASFAVMPATIEENIARIRKVGADDAFFGIHNLRFQYKLHQLMAFPWCIQPVRWGEEEPAQPVRTAGALAAWAAKRIAAEAPVPDYLFAVTSFNPNHYQGLPKWARGKPDETPSFRWEEFGAFVTDRLRVSAHLFPHEQHRPVEGAWEIHLNRPPYDQKPVYDDAAIVDLFRHLKPVVKAAETQAVFMVGGLAPEGDFIGRLCDQGLLDQVDAISLHCYGEPEKLITRLAGVRKALADHGKGSLPLYDTECGFMSVVGGVPRLKEQACKLVRQNIVLKGEGVAVHLTFYPFDFGRDGEGTYGISFSLDDSLSFGPALIAPKPAVPALAVCAHELMGAKPAGTLHGWGDDIYGYVFIRDGSEPVLALWTTGPARTLHVPAGDAPVATITDIMGKSDQRKTVGGMVDVEISDDPVYVAGIAPEIYTAPHAGTMARAYPGQRITVALPDGCDACKAWGLKTTLNAAAKQVAIEVPATCPSGPRAVLLLASGEPQVQWLLVAPPVEVVDCQPAQDGTRVDLRMRLMNHAGQAVAVAAKASVTGSGTWQAQSVTVPAGGATDVRIPLMERTAPLDSREILPVSVDLLLNGADRIRLDRRLTFLCAQRIGSTNNVVAPFADTVHLEGPGSSGATDTADIGFSWNDKQLTVTVVRQDDVQCQPYSGGDMWRGDSLQFAFDTEPDSDRLYDPMVFALTKKVTEVTVSKTAAGCAVWRHTTHNKNELPLGAATGWRVTWDRDDAKGTTRIVVGIPWTEIGLTAPPTTGQQIGIAALVNDLDGDKLPRRFLNLFDGINSSTKSYKEFGRLTLR